MCVCVTVCTGAPNLNPQTTGDQWGVGGSTEPFKVARSHTYTHTLESFSRVHTEMSSKTQLCHSSPSLSPQLSAKLSPPTCHLDASWHERWESRSMLSCRGHTLTKLQEPSGGQYDPRGEELQTGYACAHVYGILCFGGSSHQMLDNEDVSPPFSLLLLLQHFLPLHTHTHTHTSPWSQMWGKCGWSHGVFVFLRVPASCKTPHVLKTHKQTLTCWII